MNTTSTFRTCLWVLAVIGFALAIAGCSSIPGIGKGVQESARASASETHQFNMARLGAEIEHSKQPLVRFEASPEALQVLAASGEPLLLLVNNPYLQISSPEAPWWHRLVPDFRDLAWLGSTIYSTERNRSNHKDSVRSNERIMIRQMDSQDNLNNSLLGRIPEAE